MSSLAADISLPLDADRPRSRRASGNVIGRHAFILPAFALSLLICGWMTTWGDGRLLYAERFGGYYDAQARAMLHGRLDVPPIAIGFEAFIRNGKTYGYFGLAPALLRLPLVALFPSMDGRWSRLFMLIACAINLACAYRLALRAGGSERLDTPRGKIILSMLVLIAGAGSTMLFIASRSYAYHEAIMWGATFSLLFTDRLLAYLSAPTAGRLAITAALAFMAFHSRATAGAGALLALCIITATLFLRWFAILLNQRAQFAASHLVGSAPRTIISGRREMVRNADPTLIAQHDPASAARSERENCRLGVLPHRYLSSSRRTAGDYAHPTSSSIGFAAVHRPLQHAMIGVLAIALTIGTYFAVNYAKFHTFDGVPVKLYGLYIQNPQRMQITGGRQFHAENLLTTFACYFCGGAIVDASFPWLHLAQRPRIIGTPAIDVVEPYSCIPVCMPALIFLAVAGLWPVMEGTQIAFRQLRLPIVTLFLGGGIVLLTVGVTQRYLHDFYPFLIVLGAAGAGRILNQSGSRKPIFILTILVLLSVAINLDFALEFQREIVWGVPTYKKQQWARVRQSIDLRLGVRTSVQEDR